MAATTDGAGKPGSFGAAKAATGGLFGATLKSGLDKLLIHVKVQNRLRPAIPHNGEEVVPDVTIELVGVKLGSDSVPAVRWRTRWSRTGGGRRTSTWER